MFFTHPLPPRANFHSKRSNIVPVENARFKEHGTINNLVCIFYLSLYAFIHMSFVNSLLSPGSGAVHLAVGMYNRGACHLQLSLADVTLVLICFLACLPKYVWGQRVVFQIRCKKESFLFNFSREEIVVSISVFNLIQILNNASVQSFIINRKQVLFFKTEGHFTKNLQELLKEEKTFQQGPLNTLLINPFVYY